MRRIPKSRRGQPANPLSPYMVWFVLAVFGLIALASLVGWELFPAKFVDFLVVVCGLVLLAWTLFQYRTGQIPLVSNSGRRDTYRRKDGPIGFFLVVLLYLAVSMSLLLYPGYVLLFG